MIEDIVRAYGYLTLGSRMRRIGERLQADTQRIMDELEVPLQASQYPILAALDRLGPLSIGELAAAIGITQPGATRSVGQLGRTGMVRAVPGPEDQRQRIVSLTRRGEEQIAFARCHVWPRVEAAVADLCAELDGPLLGQLAAIEDGLAASPLHRRAAGKRRKTR